MIKFNIKVFFYRIGKSTFAFNLLKYQHFTKQIENVYYFGCIGGKSNELEWHTKLENVAVNYHGKNKNYLKNILILLLSEGLPSTKFLANIKPNSIVIVDDQFDEAINSPDVARAFKIDRRHNKFTIVLITQVNLQNLIKLA